MKRKLALETIEVAVVEEKLAGSPAAQFAYAATLAAVADGQICEERPYPDEVARWAARLARRMHELDREMA